MSGLQAARGAGRPAPHADDGPRAGQGLAVVPRLARHAARDGHRRGAGQSGMQEPRSHIEGATPSAAIWSFGSGARPVHSAGPAPRILDRRIPVERIPHRRHDRVGARPGLPARRRRSRPPSTPRRSPTCRRPRSAEIDAAIARNQAELERARSEYDSHERTRPTSWRSRPPRPRPPATQRGGADTAAAGRRAARRSRSPSR